MIRTQQGLCIAAAGTAIVLLLIGTLTSILQPLTNILPPKTHLLAHLFGHAVLTVSVFHAFPERIVPAPEVVCAVSVALAFIIETLQSAFVNGRSGDIGDMAAATCGSFAVFLFPRDGGSPVRPTWQALTSYVTPVPNDEDDDDEDDDDSHRVNSWAV